MTSQIDPDRLRASIACAHLMHAENMVRTRLEYGGPLTVREISDGVRLSHEEFLYLARAAMPELNRRLAAHDVIVI